MFTPSELRFTLSSVQPATRMFPIEFNIVGVESSVVETKAQTASAPYLLLDRASTAPINLFQTKKNFDGLDDTDQARAAEIEVLRERLDYLSLSLLEEEYEIQKPQIFCLVEALKKVVNSVPWNINLPNAMLLSDGMSLYWDWGETYAEIAIEGEGSVSVYGRRPGVPEFFLDTTIGVLTEAGSYFPSGLSRILA